MHLQVIQKTSGTAACGDQRPSLAKSEWGHAVCTEPPVKGRGRMQATYLAFERGSDSIRLMHPTLDSSFSLFGAHDGPHRIMYIESKCHFLVTQKCSWPVKLNSGVFVTLPETNSQSP